jgi:uncharacterized membrane protein
MKKIFSVYNIFVVSVLLKGLNALLEISGGFAAFFISKDLLGKIVAFLVRRELEEDPGDIIANYLTDFAGQYGNYMQTFIGIYLLAHGIIKIVLIYYLLKRKLFAYPIAIVVFSLFAVYQIYAYSVKSSVALIGLTILDFFVIIMTTLEYRNLRRKII